MASVSSEGFTTSPSEIKSVTDSLNSLDNKSISRSPSTTSVNKDDRWPALVVSREPKRATFTRQIMKTRDPMMIERSNLVNISKLIVKELIETSLKYGRMLDTDHMPLQHFFIVLEHVLRHGLKPKKGLLGPKKELWDILQVVEKYTIDAQDITSSVRDLPTVSTHMGRARAWLRLALMQKKLGDYLKLLIDHREDLLSEYFEPDALMMSEEAIVIVGLLVGLNVIDCNLCVKEEDLDCQQGVIDFSLYLRSSNYCSENSSEEDLDQEHMTTVLDQKNYIEELNRHLNATVTNLQSKVETLMTTNALMKEDLAIAKNNILALNQENMTLKKELGLDVNADRTDEGGGFVEVGGRKADAASKSSELEELRQQLENEKRQRQEAEKELDLQISLKAEMEVAMKLLEKDIHEKQDTIISLRRQLDDIKLINLEMYRKLQECEQELTEKGIMVSRLQAKTSQIGQILNNLEKYNHLLKDAEKGSNGVVLPKQQKGSLKPHNGSLLAKQLQQNSSAPPKRLQLSSSAEFGQLQKIPMFSKQRVRHETDTPKQGGRENGCETFKQQKNESETSKQPEDRCEMPEKNDQLQPGGSETAEPLEQRDVSPQPSAECNDGCSSQNSESCHDSTVPQQGQHRVLLANKANKTRLKPKSQDLHSDNGCESLRSTSRYKHCKNERAAAEESSRKLGQQVAEKETKAASIEGDLRIEREWRTSLQETMVKDRDKISQLNQELAQLKIVASKYLALQEEFYQLKEQCGEQEQTLEELGNQLRISKLQVADLKEEATRNNVGEGQWAPDKEVSNCKGCSKEFNITRRRHHCRNCGEIFCNSCSDNTMSLPSSAKPVRVCDECHVMLVARYSVL